jgi:basic membrane protein A and related proteins
MSGKRMITLTLGIVLVVAMILTACRPAAPQAGDTGGDSFKVGLLHPSPITDAWSGLAYNALLRMEAELGAEIANVEVTSPAEYEKGFIDFANAGFDLVIGHSFSMQDSVLKVAPNYPNTFFSITGGNQSLANYTPVDLIPGFKQALYAAGVMAGQITKTGKAVAFTIELPSTKIPLEGFCAGFESTPGHECSMVILRDGSDVGAAKEAALQAIANGADILTANANIAGNGVWQAVAENEGRAYAVGTIADQAQHAPKGVLVSSTLNVPEALFSLGQGVKDGTIQGGSVRVFTINDPDVFGFVFNPDTSDLATNDMKTLLDDTVKKIQSGEIVVR